MVDQVCITTQEHGNEETQQEVPEGYKQTEVGIVPNEWKIYELGSITQTKRPISYGIVQTGPRIAGGVKCLRVVDISKGIISKNDLITTTIEISNSYKRTQLQLNDLVIPLRGKVGEVGIVHKDLVGENLTRGVALIALKNGYCAQYIKQIISYEASARRLENSMNGSALQEIPIATLRSFKVVIPQEGEQTAIANALSDVDALIGSLEKLIAKKRAIKTAAMQQLLTGKKRLPPFDQTHTGYKQTEVGIVPKNWVVLKIKDFSKTGSGTTPARAQEDRYFKGGKIYWVKTTDLNNSIIRATEDKVTELALKETCLQVYPIGSVLVAMYGGFNQIGRTGLLTISAAVNQALVAVQVNQKTDPRYLLNTLNYKVEYWKSVASSSRKDPNITSSDVKGFKLALPPTKEEQTAIANVLSDMDKDMDVLDQRLNKTQQLKQGMMQELLTGRTRLV